MIRKSQLFLAVAALVGMNAAMAACNITQWGQGSPTLPGGGVMTQGTAVGTPTPGNPTSGDPDGVVKRYSGTCGLRSTAAGNYVQDGLPTGEPGFIARFYVFTGVTGEADVFHARTNGVNAATDAAGVADDYNIVRVTFDSTAGFKFYPRTGAAQTVAAQPAKWYAVELKWDRAASTLDVDVKGAGLAAVNPAAYSGFDVTPATSHGIDYVRLGWISGGTAAGGVFVDAYESRRSTDIGRLKRGDVNGDTFRDSGDLVPLLIESAGGALATGQPECNEDGFIDGGDLPCLLTLLVNPGVE